MKNNLHTYVLIILILVLFLTGCTVPDYLYGHDNGEAYEEYTEQMERLAEMGLAPDIYGYGW